MEGAPKVKKEVTEHSLLKDETQNSMRRIIPIENYRRMIWGRRTEQFWASLLHPPIDNKCPVSPHQLPPFVHLVFSPAKVSLGAGNSQ